MKKIVLLVGVAIGFVLGSRAGRVPYQQLEAKVRGYTNRKDVQDTVSHIRDTAKDQANMVASKVADKLPRSQSSAPPPHHTLISGAP